MEEHNNRRKRGRICAAWCCTCCWASCSSPSWAAQLVNFGPQEEIDELITSDFVTAVNDGRVDEVTYHAASATLDGTYYKDEAAKEAGELSSFKSTYTGDDMLQELMAPIPRQSTTRTSRPRVGSRPCSRPCYLSCSSLAC